MNNKNHNELNESRHMIKKIAEQYQNQGLTQEQLIENGFKGLLKAADHYDESKGYSFLSYAIWWVRQSMLQALAAVNRSDENVNHDALTPREQTIIRGIENGESMEKIAKDLGLTEQRLMQLVNRIKYKTAEK
ncbi:MAG: hypothetical protein IJ528_02360 [Bacteroidaceae bacterium]|nr:hypothetical protein [Bacteroidaceae bacterium]